MAETPGNAGPTLLGTASSTIVTAGGAATWTLIRKLVICNELSTPVNVTVGMGTTNSDAAGKRLLKAETIQPGSSLIEDGFMVLNGSASTPQLLYAFCDNANGATITLFVVTGP